MFEGATTPLSAFSHLPCSHAMFRPSDCHLVLRVHDLLARPCHPRLSAHSALSAAGLQRLFLLLLPLGALSSAMQGTCYQLPLLSISWGTSSPTAQSTIEPSVSNHSLSPFLYLLLRTFHPRISPQASAQSCSTTLTPGCRDPRAAGGSPAHSPVGLSRALSLPARAPGASLLSYHTLFTLF